MSLGTQAEDAGSWAPPRPTEAESQGDGAGIYISTKASDESYTASNVRTTDVWDAGRISGRLGTLRSEMALNATWRLDLVLRAKGS